MPDTLDFSMTIEDIFFIRGRGTIVTGIISQGTLNDGDVVTLNGSDFEKQTQVIGIEVFLRRTNSAGAGERIAVVLRGISKDEVSRGDVLESSDPDYDDR